MDADHPANGVLFPRRITAEILEVEPITVGRLVDRLEGRGLIERRADPRDRRCWRLFLTAAATPVLAEIDAARDQLDAEATTDLPDALRQATITTLLTMKRNLLAVSVAAPEGLVRNA